MTDKNQLSFLCLGSSLESVQGHQIMALWHQILMQIGITFEQQIQPNISCYKADILQYTIANIIISILINVYI